MSEKGSEKEIKKKTADSAASDRKPVCYTYILRCSDGTYYTGWTNDLEKRLASHNDGTGSKYTRVRRPVVLAYCEQFETKQEAMRREWEIKHMSRAQKQQLIDAAKR